MREAETKGHMINRVDQEKDENSDGGEDGGVKVYKSKNAESVVFSCQTRVQTEAETRIR